MKEAGFRFTVEKPDVEESFPDAMPVNEVARFLAAKKAAYFKNRVRDEIVVTADTVVILHNKILNKPRDRNEAIDMLSALSGKTHLVMTGVCISTREKEYCYDDTTEVTFQTLTKDDIGFYVDHYKPYDKAGAYGAQDCLPPGMNPCSEEEMNFLRSINRPDLVKKTFSSSPSGIVIIKKINGSYFNVMGLPVHTVYSYLKNW